MAALQMETVLTRKMEKMGLMSTKALFAPAGGLSGGGRLSPRLLRGSWEWAKSCRHLATSVHAAFEGHDVHGGGICKLWWANPPLKSRRFCFVSH